MQEGAVLRVLGIQVAFGQSAEAKVFASLLRHSPGHVETLVIHQYSEHDPSAAWFEETSNSPTRRIEMGWRARAPGPTKVLSVIRLFGGLICAEIAARKFKPDVIYSNGQRWDSLIGYYLSRRLGKPHVVHLHYPLGRWSGRYTLPIIKACSHLITVSDFIARDAIQHEIEAQKITTILNGIEVSELGLVERDNTRTQLSIKKHDLAIIMVARFDAEKRHSDVIKAFSLLASDYPDALLLFAGTGELEDELKRESMATGFGDRIRFLGFQRNIASVLGAFDVFIHPSKQDACPLAVLEAQAAGLPVVAYADGGIPEIVDAGNTGFLAPDGDVVALSNYLRLLLTEPSLRYRLGLQAKQHVSQKLSPDVASLRFNDVLHSAARTDGARAVE